MQPWGRVQVSPQRIHITISLSCFADSEAPTRREKLIVCRPQAKASKQTLDRLEPEGWWCWLPITSPPTNQKNFRKLTTPSLNHSYKTPHNPLQGGTHSLEGISPPWPPFAWQSNKAVLSYFTQNSVSDFRYQGTEAKFRLHHRQARCTFQRVLQGSSGAVYKAPTWCWSCQAQFCPPGVSPIFCVSGPWPTAGSVDQG